MEAFFVLMGLIIILTLIEGIATTQKKKPKKKSKLVKYKFDTTKYIVLKDGVKRSIKTGRLENIKRKE